MFEALKEIVAEALRLVDLPTIRRWKQRMFQYFNAYKGGLGVVEAVNEVRKLSNHAKKKSTSSIVGPLKLLNRSC